jgi:hypothetical protein
MEWLIDLGLMLLIVLVVKEKFISINIKKPILTPIKIRETNREQYKKRGNYGC